MLNANKPERWNDDTRRSVLQYNEWFMDFAPTTFQSARGACVEQVDKIFAESDALKVLTSDLLVKMPDSLSTLRMMCAPPIAVDRLAGLAGVSNSKVKTIEKGSLPTRGKADFIQSDIPALLNVIVRLLDKQLMN